MRQSSKNYEIIGHVTAYKYAKIISKISWLSEIDLSLIFKKCKQKTRTKKS